MKAVAYGAGTIVNAIVGGKGCAFGIDLSTKAYVEEIKKGMEFEIEGEPHEDTKLLKCCAKNVLNCLKVKTGLFIRTKSNIPIARGLKSSSVASNAVVLAIAKTLGAKLKDNEVIKLSVKSARDAKVTITGALDDTAASYYGGIVLTDNLKNRIIRREKIPSLKAVIFYPEKKSYTSKVKLKADIKKEINRIWNVARERKYHEALTLNGLTYCKALSIDPLPAFLALNAGALSAGLSGKGPAFIALCRKQDKNEIKRSWEKLEGKIIIANTNNKKAK